MSASDNHFIVDETLRDAALPAALRRFQPGSSWSQVKRLIRSRKVLVNETVCLDEGRRLKPGETIRITGGANPAPPSAAAVEIRYLDRHVVVVDKPPGMRSISHSSERKLSAERRNLHPALQDVLPGLIAREEARRSNRSGRKERSGALPAVRVVHRIDRETSGLLVFARTDAAMQSLMTQFKEHTVDRLYLTVVSGRVEAGRYESYLVEDRGDGRRGSTRLKGAGQRAVTHVRPIEFLGVYTWLECRLETGRTHQIRIHLSEAGHPVCGDKRYHQPLFAPARIDGSGAPRLALHAAKLGFVHPETSETLSFESPWPADLARWLNRLRG